MTNTSTTKIELNPKRGEKEDFVKASITLPPEMYRTLMEMVYQRKIQKIRKASANETSDASISAVIRDALGYYLCDLQRKHKIETPKTLELPAFDDMLEKPKAKKAAAC